jgi:cyclophilin family peptidyl-prolyl cis-trans isomerase
VLARLVEDYPDDVRLVYRQFPLNSIHDKSALAAQASEAAGLQGSFWEMHDLLYQKQAEWAALDVAAFENWLIDQADELGLDKKQFADDLTSDEIVKKVQDAYDHASSIGLPGTPFLLFNGYPYQSSMAYEDLANVIEFFKLEDKQYTSCPPQIIDADKNYEATISTEKGDIVVELYADKAPLAVNNFVFLAQEGWFDNITFHRVIPDFMAQSGDPSGTGLGGPGYEFANEIDPDLTFDGAGVLAMANHGADTNGSQFFITYAEAPDLNGGYTIFGKVISGMDVVESLMPRDPSQGGGLPPGDKIISITIEEK